VVFAVERMKNVMLVLLINIDAYHK